MPPPKDRIVVVTGSSGLIGAAVCRRLEELGYRTFGFDRPGLPHPPEMSEAVDFDVTDQKSVDAALEKLRRDGGDRIASVVHLAAYYDFSGQPSDLYEKVTVRGTQRLLVSLQRLGFHVEQFLFSSTMLVHAPGHPGSRINEEAPVEATWDYPRSKIETERTIREKRGAISVVLLRLAGVYTDDCQSIPIAHQIQRIYQRELTSHVFPGDTDAGQSFVHLDDAVEAIRLCVDRRGVLPPVFDVLIGEEEVLSYRDLQHELGELIHGKEWHTLQVPKLVAKLGAHIQEKLPDGDPFIKPWMIDRADDHYAIDATRAKNLLGWQPKHSLRQTLPRMVQALKHDPAAFYRRNKLKGTPPNSQEPPAGSHDGHERHGGHEMANLGHAQMIRKWIWRDFLNITLGVWLISSPFTMEYFQASPKMAWSDLISGAAIIVLGVLVLFPRFDLARWGICFTGIWLLFAPLVFWTPSAAAYNNNSLIGALLITFSVLIPMMPGRAHHRVMMTPGPDTPPGWSYNPSEWVQRGPIIAMALLGFFLSRYLAAYQLGHVSWPWDPFFADGTRRVLDSDISKAWPISDAGLGALSYILEALSGFMGGRNRWRTMPWMVAMFGVLVVPLGVVSIVLIILQPVAVGAWCTLCLITAAAMLIMIAPSVDEVVAMCQFLAGARREGKPLWRTFWSGGTLESYRTAAAPADIVHPIHSRSLTRQIIAAVDLDNVPWNLLTAAALGVWLMFAPAALGSTRAAADSDHLIGALIVTWSVIAFAEVARPIRFLNIPLGLWLIAAPWFLSGDTAASRWNGIAVGAAIVLLSFRRGRIQQQFGGWNRYLV